MCYFFIGLGWQRKTSYKTNLLSGAILGMIIAHVPLRFYWFVQLVSILLVQYPYPYRLHLQEDFLIYTESIVSIAATLNLKPFISRSKLKSTSDRSYREAAPTIRNSLPLNIRTR